MKETTDPIVKKLELNRKMLKYEETKRELEPLLRKTAEEAMENGDYYTARMCYTELNDRAGLAKIVKEDYTTPEGSVAQRLLRKPATEGQDEESLIPIVDVLYHNSIILAEQMLTQSGIIDKIPEINDFYRSIGPVILAAHYLADRYDVIVEDGMSFKPSSAVVIKLFELLGGQSKLITRTQTEETDDFQGKKVLQLSSDYSFHDIYKLTQGMYEKGAAIVDRYYVHCGEGWNQPNKVCCTTYFNSDMPFGNFAEALDRLKKALEK